MIKITQSLKEEFEEFCKNKFPKRKIVSNKGFKTRWFYVEAGHNFQEFVHYEFEDGKVHLHLETPDNPNIIDIEELNTYISKKEKTSGIVGEKRNGNEFQWTLNRKVAIENETELFDDFLKMFEIFEPIIEEYEIIHDIKNGVAASIRDVNSLLSLNLFIPEFQRPYVWTTKNVLQLLNDVSMNLEERKDSYRIGSIILYYNEGESRFEIVDGQQRLTTILLILLALDQDKDIPILEKFKYEHSESFENIKRNYEYLSEWKNQNSNCQGFEDYLLYKCEFVQITVKNLSEAFQMFDSQNGRGKPLEAYNLLKAYHLRAMECNSQEEKIDADKRWESAVRYKNSYDKDNNNVQDILKKLFAEQLYRARRWTKYNSAGRFSKKKIDEFKGYTIDKNTNISFPYQNPQLLQYITNKFYQSVLSGTISIKGRLNNGDPSNMDPFTNINQEILNGKPFFDYIETYVEMYKLLFVDLKGYQLKDFKGFYSKYCINYDGANRKGDRYLLELYKSLIFVLFDKFGEKILNQFYENIYALVYQKRLIYKQIKFETVDYHKDGDFIFPHDYFFRIQNAKNISDLKFLKEKNDINENDIHFRAIDDEGKNPFDDSDVFYTFFKNKGLIKDGTTK